MSNDSNSETSTRADKPQSRMKEKRGVGGSDRFSSWMRSIWRQRWLSLICAWVICVAGWTVVALWPSQYMSSAVIYADLQGLADQDQNVLKEGVTSDQLADGGPIPLLKTMLLSDEGLAAVRKEIDPDGVSLDELGQEIMIRSTAPTLFVATYYHRDPTTAHQVLSGLFSSLTTRLSNVDVDEPEVVNLEQEIADVEKRLEDAEVNLADFRRINADFFEATDHGPTDLARLEQEALDLKQQIDIALVERDEVAERLAQLPLSQDAPRDLVQADSFSESQVAELEALQAKLAELRERYADTHPYVSTVINAIEALNAKSSAEEPSSANGTESSGVPAENDDISEELAELKRLHEEKIADLVELNNDLANKQREIDRLEALTDSTSSVEAEQSRLETEKKDLEAALTKLISRRDALQPRTDADPVRQGEKAEQTSFRLINGPSLPDKPAGLPRLAGLALVLLGGLGIGGGIAVLRNRSKGVFESAWQLKQRFDVGVLGTISEVLSPAERKQLGYSKLAFGLGCFGLAGIFGGLVIAEFLNLLTPWGDSLRIQLLG